MLLLQAKEGAGPAVLGAARAALNGACAPAETPSDARAVAHALLSQVEALRRKPERALVHIQQVCLAGARFLLVCAYVSALLYTRWFEKVLVIVRVYLVAPKGSPGDLCD